MLSAQKCQNLSFIGLDLMNPGEGQAVCIVVRERCVTFAVLCVWNAILCWWCMNLFHLVSVWCYTAWLREPPCPCPYLQFSWGFMLSRLLVVDILVIMIGWLQLSALSSSCYCFFPCDDHIMLVVIAEVNTHHTVCHCQKHRLLRLKFLWIQFFFLLLLLSAGYCWCFLKAASTAIRAYLPELIASHTFIRMASRQRGKAEKRTSGVSPLINLHLGGREGKGKIHITRP